MGLFDGLGFDPMQYGSMDSQSALYAPFQGNVNMFGEYNESPGYSNPTQGGSPQVSDAILESSILQQFGVKPENLHLDETGHIKMTDQDRKMAMAAALDALGAGLVAGAMSGSWGGVGMGISQGISGANKAFRAEKEASTKRKQEGEMVKLNAARVAAGTAREEFGLGEAKGEAERQKQLREAVAAGVDPMIQDMTKAVTSMKPAEGEDPETFKARQAVLLGQLKYAKAAISSGAATLEGITAFGAVAEKVPGIQEYFAKWQAELEGKGKAIATNTAREGISAGTQAIADKSGAKTELDTQGNRVIVTPDTKLDRAYKGAQIKHTEAATDAIYTGGLGGGSALPLTEGEAAASLARVDKDTKSLQGANRAIATTASRIRGALKDVGVGMNIDGMSNTTLVQQAFIEGSMVNEALKKNDALSPVAQALGVDPAAAGMDPNAITKEGKFNFESIVADLKQSGIGYDPKTGNFSQDGKIFDISNPDAISQAVKAREDRMMGAVNPSTADKLVIREKIRSVLKNEVRDYINRVGGSDPDKKNKRASLLLGGVHRAEGDALVNKVIRELGQAETGPETVALERRILEMIREEISAGSF